MSLFSGFDFGDIGAFGDLGIGASPGPGLGGGMLGGPPKPKGGGGLFGSGVSGAQLSEGLGALGGLGGGPPPEPYQFQPIPIPHVDLSGIMQPIQRPQIQPLNLANYFQPYGGRY